MAADWKDDALPFDDAAPMADAASPDPDLGGWHDRRTAPRGRPDPDTATGRLTRRFRSGDHETRSALADLCAQLALQGLDEDDLGTLELILAEALNNVTEHAYGPEGGPVEVSIDLIPDRHDTPAATGSGSVPRPDDAGSDQVEHDGAAPTSTRSGSSGAGSSDTTTADLDGRTASGRIVTQTAARQTTADHSVDSWALSRGGGGRVLCEVRDYGRPMPPGGPPGPGLPTISPPDDLPEGGFGWHIIRCLVAELSYERLGSCNRLRLEVYASHPLHRPAPSAGQSDLD